MITLFYVCTLEQAMCDFIESIMYTIIIRNNIRVYLSNIDHVITYLIQITYADRGWVGLD